VRENLDIVASSLDMAAAELELISRMNREYILKKLLQPLEDNYDFILLDCPPSLGLVTINALVAAKELFIPLTAEALPSRGLTKLTNILQMVRENLNRDIFLSGIIITRWEPTKLSKMVEQQLRANFGDTIYKTKIRKNVAIAEAPLYFTDIVTYSPDSNGARDYRALADEIQGTADEPVIFFKEFRESEYSIGEFVGEPNEDGEQDYKGYSISDREEQTEFSIIKAGEDFLSGDEVEDLLSGGSMLELKDRATLNAVGQLYEETLANQLTWTR
jgi:MinD-like ATPase involved in chromosome partitioning or flagellar assembly